jgi:UPF0755 protein
LVLLLTQTFDAFISGAVREGFGQQGLDVYSAVTLASIIEREGIHDDEHAQIASVFLNRLRQGMKLDSDPTVQYAMGYNTAQQTWWTNPLSIADLQFESNYNTYLSPGLPPAPISNPGESALRAVAWPATTAYFYFRANCAGDGHHSFGTTFEEHLQNACP